MRGSRTRGAGGERAGGGCVGLSTRQGGGEPERMEALGVGNERRNDVVGDALLAQDLAARGCRVRRRPSGVRLDRVGVG
jgi:hypothetical protein